MVQVIVECTDKCIGSVVKLLPQRWFEKSTLFEALAKLIKKKQILLSCVRGKSELIISPDYFVKGGE